MEMTSALLQNCTGFFKNSSALKRSPPFHVDSWNVNVFFTFSFGGSFLKMAILFGKFEYSFLVHCALNKGKATLHKSISKFLY